MKLDAFRGQRWKLKNRWGSDLHTMVTRVADGVPRICGQEQTYWKEKGFTLFDSLLWLTDYSEPVQVNHMCTSVTLLWEILENPLSESDNGNPVPGSVQCGLNLAKLRIIVDTPESMTCQVAQEVHTGALRNGTSLRIEL